MRFKPHRKVYDMLTSIIIDRVGTTNVFNIVQESGVNNPALKPSERLQSVIDDDLIGEEAQLLFTAFQTVVTAGRLAAQTHGQVEGNGITSIRLKLSLTLDHHVVAGAFETVEVGQLRSFYE